LGYNPWLCGFARGDLVVKHKQHWDTYIRLGFLGHSMGIETFNHDAGKLVRKGMDPDKLQQGLLEFQAYTDIHAPKRYRANIQMICGIPGESVESWNNSLEWLNTHWLRQSASAHILEVPDYDETLTNQSRFTKELVSNGLVKLEARQNPGYEISKDNNGNVIFKSTTPRGGGVGSTRNDIVVWQHNTMDWNQAESLVKEFYSVDGFKGLRGCNPFLTDRLFVYHETNKYEDVYEYNLSKINTADTKFRQFAQSYIDKKLNV
jgi:hypothetical protein